MAWTLENIPDQTGRVAVMTGGNGGLGLVTTRALAARGAHVVMAARHPVTDRAGRRGGTRRGARRQARCGPPRPRLAPIGASLCRADRFGYKSIDLLVNNAGVMAIPRAETADGFEMQLGVNHLGHFSLTAHLFPLLLRGKLTQGGHRQQRRPSLLARGVDLRPPPACSGMGRGAHTGNQSWPTCSSRWSCSAVSMLRRSVLASLAADPGFSATDLQAQSHRASGGGWSQAFFYRAVSMFGSTPEVGALPQLRAATDPAARGGQLFGLRWVAHGGPVPVRVPRRRDQPRRRRRLVGTLGEGDRDRVRRRRHGWPHVTGRPRACLASGQTRRRGRSRMPDHPAALAGDGLEDVIVDGRTLRRPASPGPARPRGSGPRRKARPRSPPSCNRCTHR